MGNSGQSSLLDIQVSNTHKSHSEVQAEYKLHFFSVINLRKKIKPDLWKTNKITENTMRIIFFDAKTIIFQDNLSKYFPTLTQFKTL